MGLTVQMAGRLGAYALTDRATWAKSGDRARTEVLVQGDPRLFNPYEIILVDAKRHPHVNLAAANAFIDWLISEDGRKAIAGNKGERRAGLYAGPGSDQLSRPPAR